MTMHYWREGSYYLLETNVNHLLLVSLWTLFIVVGTLAFEESGLRGKSEFGQKYEKYSSHVWAFVLSPWSIGWLLSGGKKQLEKQR